jgi:two-component system chemotaxis response regulator CheB
MPEPQPTASDAASRPRRLVVIGASAGGFQALRAILASLPRDFPIPIAVVLHRSGEDNLPRALILATGARVKHAAEGERIEPGTVYVAPAGLHLRVNPDQTFALADGSRIRFARSSANPLFETAAQVYGPGAIAVVLSGYGRDGTDGVQAVKSRGGTVIAQDEESSQQFSMPRSAIETGAVDKVLPLEQIGPALARLAAGGTL